MDPLSHVLFGRTLIGLDHRRRLGPSAAATCALGALAPDIDAVFVSRGWDVYLGVHEIGTHSVLGSLAVASATAALVHLVRRQTRYYSLLLAAWIGALSHLVFDLIAGATLRPGWPLLPNRVSLPLVAMADPWLVAICVAGVFAMWAARHRMPAAAATVLLTIAAFLALKAALMAAALPHWVAARGATPVVSHTVEAGWGSLVEWNVFDRTPDTLRKWRVTALPGDATLVFSLPIEPEPAIVTASRSLDTVRNFHRLHNLGFSVTLPIENGATQVLWSDIRYCSSSGSAQRQPAARGSLECGLWFGGTLDVEGRAVRQTVHIGAWRQIRPAAP